MKVYVLVRQDLDYSSKAVQGGHALAELCYKHDLREWERSHKTLVYLRVKSEKELLHYFESIPIKEKSLFHESDYKSEFTAMAVLAKNEEDRRLFKKLQLL